MLLLLLSPAKTLDYASPVPGELMARATVPRFLKQSEALIRGLRRRSARSLAALMDLSPTLAELNVERYRAWQAEHSPVNARPALLAFNGDVYEGLQARSLRNEQFAYAQRHVRMLSGLYGLLRPLDLMQAHRLEMGTPLTVGKARNLPEYWRQPLSDALAEDLLVQSTEEHRGAADANPGTACVVNLASQEYFKAVHPPTLEAAWLRASRSRAATPSPATALTDETARARTGVRIVHCAFQDRQGTQFRVVGVHAKRARGLMARFAIDHAVERPEDLQQFQAEGYAFNPEASSRDDWVFRRG